MSYQIAAAAFIVALLPACGNGERPIEPDTLAVDTVDSAIVVDSTLLPIDTTKPAGESGSGEATPGAPPSPIDKEPVVEENPLSGRYRLVSVQGESLPATIGVGPECELFLGDGQLRIHDDGRFAIRTKTWEDCNGERGNEQAHEAEGRMSRDGDRIRFEATYDSMFGSASGNVRGREIHIDTFETEGGEQEVDWTFRR